MAMNSSYCWNYVSDQCLTDATYSCNYGLDLSCKGFLNWTECYCTEKHDLDIKQRLDAPMPWIGMYIAAASAVCTVAMALDAFKGFRTRQFWFPCKYFSLNATSLTLLAVAMKLAVDISDLKWGDNNSSANICSLALMSTAVSNLMTSLASMDDNELILNLTALGILIVTIVVNVCLYIVQLQKAFYNGVDEDLRLAIYFLPMLLVLLCSSAVMLPTSKRYIDLKFKEMHKNVVPKGKVLTFQELTLVLKKYWVMAGTGNPQFVMARSVISVIPGPISLLMVLYVVRVCVTIGTYQSYFFEKDKEMSYKWSINWILFTQMLGIAIGSIAPISRWFVATRFRGSREGFKSYLDELKIESYWTQRLVDWRESAIPLRIRHHVCKRVVRLSARLLLNVCIGFQILVIIVAKLVLIISTWFIVLLPKAIRQMCSSSESRTELETENFSPENFSHELLLEGEPELPKKTIAIISKEVDDLIQMGRGRKPKNLIELLQTPRNYSEVRGSETTSAGEESCTNWSLAVVTLMRIAISLPGIPTPTVNKLLSSVDEGLSFVKHIEKNVEANGESKNLRKAGEIVWGQIELYQDPQYNKQRVEELLDTTKKVVMDFQAKTSSTDLVMRNPLNRPANIIAANSICNICEALLLTENQSDDQIFERIRIIISDIFAHCITNLTQVIIMKCYRNSIEKRLDSIREAAILLGESEEVVQFITQCNLSSDDPKIAGYIKAWQVVPEQFNENRPVTSAAATDGGSIQESTTGHVSLEVKR